MNAETAFGRTDRAFSRAVEWLVAGVCALWGALEQILSGHSVPLSIGLVLLIPVLVPLIVCRRYPLVAAALLGAAAPLRALTGAEAGADVTPLQICVVVVWAVGRYSSSLWRAMAAALVAVAGVMGGVLVAGRGAPIDLYRVLLSMVFFACVLAAGVIVRGQSQAAGSERAARQALEREREQRKHDALLAERSRIARELHDLVAHGVAAVFVQAGVADQCLEIDGARAERALRAARQRARTVLSEMRRLLSVLRAHDAAITSADNPASSDQGSASPTARNWPALGADLSPALVLVVFGLIELGLVRSSAPLGLRVLGAAAFGSVVFVRRVLPVAAAATFAVVLVLRAADGQLGAGSHSATLALLILGWSLGTQQIGRAKLLAALATVEAAIMVAVPVAGSHSVAADVAVLGLLFLAAIGAGSTLRRWRTAAEQERERRAVAVLESTVQPKRAVAEERARIARELHDVVAHSVSIISVQAGAAEMLARRDPPRAREAVAAVLTAAHQALAELRQLVDMLGGDDDATLAYQPQPGLPDLAELVANGRELGLAIDLVDEREPSEIPAGVQLTVYRIVQEALTNAAKHAGRVPVSVRLFGRPGELDVEIRNPMTADSVDGADTGHGLLGMRERVRLYGGHLAAGPDPERWWLVRVTLPVEEGEAQGDPDLDRR